MSVSPDPTTTQSALSERLADPQVANALASLLGHADLLALLVEGLDQFLARSEIIGDSLLSGIVELRSAVEGNAAFKQSGVSVGELTDAAASLAAVLPRATPGIVAAVESGAVDKLLASGVVSAEALDQMELLARGLVRGTEDFSSRPVQVGGLLSIGRMLKDPDIARALSFFATVAKSVGQELSTIQSTNR
jgi:hypothetical protein